MFSSTPVVFTRTMASYKADSLNNSIIKSKITMNYCWICTHLFKYKLQVKPFTFLNRSGNVSCSTKMNSRNNIYSSGWKRTSACWTLHLYVHPSLQTPRMKEMITGRHLNISWHIIPIWSFLSISKIKSYLLGIPHYSEKSPIHVALPCNYLNVEWDQ